MFFHIVAHIIWKDEEMKNKAKQLMYPGLDGMVPPAAKVCNDINP